MPNYLLKGNFVKNLIRNCKFLGLELDLVVVEENKIKNLLITLLGPNELVGRNIKYANNLYSLFIKNFDSLRNEITEIMLETQYYESKKSIYLPLTEFPKIIDDTQEEIFDSTIEKVFNEQWSINFPHWVLSREPLIVEHDLVMIPDFLLTYRTQNFYLEIVGFWTERYLTKKIKKVSLLKTKYPNMILLVDKSLDWPQTTVPTFFYDKKVPILEIGTFLKQFEDKELLQFIKKIDFNKIKLEINSYLETNQVLKGEDLYNIVKANYSFELKKIMQEYFNYYKNKCSFVFFSNHDFLTGTDFLFDLKKYLVSSNINSTLSVQKLKKQFSFLDEKILKVIVMYLGYDFKYRSLLDEELVFKKEKAIFSEII